MFGGKDPPSEEEIKPMLERVLAQPSRPPLGLGRRAIDEDHWLILAVGEHAATAVIFSLEPSFAQARLVRDLHADFERANKAALARGWIVPDHMVFPQRALTESAF
jgi:seryl-tRNA synthetase